MTLQASRRAVWLVAHRELSERLRDKSFAISTAITLLVIAAFVLGPRLLGGGPDTYRLGVVGNTTRPLAEAVREAAPGAGATVTLTDVADRAEAQVGLRAEELDAALVPRDPASGAPGAPGHSVELVALEEPPAGLAALVAEHATRAWVTERLRGAGVPPDEVSAVLTPPPVPQRALEPTGGGNAGVAAFVVFLLYGQLFGYGMAVATGIVEEKSTRVVEVVLAKVSPGQLLAGKILGIGLLGLGQLLLIAGVGSAVAFGTGIVILPPGAGTAIAAAVGWFVLGYGFYACMFAVAGALVSRQEELQNSAAPLTRVVFGALAMAFAALQNPDSTLARVGSWLPPTAPMVLPVRMALGEVAPWETAGAIAVMLVAVCAMVALAARIYRGAVLQTGGHLRLAQAWRAAHGRG